MASPPLPPGFVLEQSASQSGAPALPPGFQLEQPEAPAEQPGLISQIGRQAGLAGRYALEGAGNLAGIVTDPFGQFLPGYQRTGEAASSLADTIGLPRPQGGLEEGVGAASRALTGTALTAGAGLAAGAPALAAQPGLQAASSVTGGGAADIARQNGYGGFGQFAAGVLGSLAPATASGGAMALRGAIRGGEEGRQLMQQNIDNFAAAGTTPTVGQASQGRLAQATETLLSRVPGGAGRMADKAARQSDEIGAQVGAYADSLAPGANPATAGRAIERGITGAGGFVDRLKSQARKLYDAVDEHMPGQTAVPLNATRQYLGKVTTPTPGAEATSAILANPKLAQIAGALDSDMQKAIASGATTGQLPYEAVKSLRTRVGEMIADAGLVSDVPKAQLKQLYGALSQDIRNQASKNPQAYAATNRAENYYRAGMDRLERVESVVDKAGGPEKVFAAAMSGTREGATTLRSVMQSLKKDEANMVSSAVIRRMGRARPSAQDDVGEAFSTETFLTNWNSLSPQAKNTLFDRMGPDFRANMDRIAKATSNVRAGGEVFRAPSGTPQGAAQIATATAFVMNLLSGNMAAVGGIAAAVAGANLGARLMTNPKFVQWAARQTQAPVGALRGQIGWLVDQGRKDGDEDLTEAAQLIGQSLQ